MTDEKRWDCHEHRDEMFVIGSVVYHPEHGSLCSFIDDWHDGTKFRVWQGIQFKNPAAAQKWINEGFIADLQEGFGTLQVQFSNRAVHRFPASY